MLYLKVVSQMGKHPVSTTIRMDINKELEALCKHLGCSKYAFIEEAINEKMEKVKVERTQEKERDPTRDDKQSSQENREVRDNSREKIVNDID